MSVDLEPEARVDPTAATADWPLEPWLSVTDRPRGGDRKGFEEIDGVWVEKKMGNPAITVEANILGVVRNFVRSQQLGRVLGANGAYRMFPDRPALMRKPDVSFVASGRLSPEEAAQAEWRIAPDLAVEVISPNEEAQDAEQKLDEYLRAGVRLMWVAYLPTRNIWAYRPDGTARRYRAEETLTGEDVLPGFAVPVAELFEGV
jgi:Uma2 family endonuclease